MFDNQHHQPKQPAGGLEPLATGLAQKRIRNLDMTNSNTGRLAVACHALVYLAIAFGALAFWSDAAEAGGFVDYLVATMLTATFGFLSIVLSGVVTRYAEARESKQWFTAATVAILGVVLGVIEAGMTNHGLTWLDARHDLATWEILLAASIGLSAFNVLGLYVFARELPRVKAANAPSTERSSDEAVFGSAPQTASELARNLANERWKKTA